MHRPIKPHETLCDKKVWSSIYIGNYFFFLFFFFLFHYSAWSPQKTGLTAKTKFNMIPLFIGWEREVFGVFAERKSSTTIPPFHHMTSPPKCDGILRAGSILGVRVRVRGVRVGEGALVASYFVLLNIRGALSRPVGLLLI